MHFVRFIVMVMDKKGSKGDLWIAPAALGIQVKQVRDGEWVYRNDITCMSTGTSLAVALRRF
jgi:hypothetical protein